MASLKNHSFFIFLFLTIVLGIIIFSPYINFQNVLQQGDHGRDLYAAEAVLRGEIPYKNFTWVYGPLMPYYYAVFFKLFGFQIPSILLGKIILNIACGIFCFLAVSEFFAPSAAFATALWLMCFQQDFPHTYNHVGALALILASTWMHFRYIRHSRIRSAYAALIFIFFLGFVQINFGVVALLMTILTVSISDQMRPMPFNKSNRSLYITALLIPLIWVAVCRWITWGLSIAEIRQCFPYLKGDDSNNTLSFMQIIQNIPALFHQYLQQIQTNPVFYAVALIVIVCLLRIPLLLLMKSSDSPLKKEGLFLIAYAALYYFLNLNEYLLSGIFYRSYWSQPLSILLCAFIIMLALHRAPLFLKNILWVFFIVICLLHIKQNSAEIKTFKTPEHFLDLPKTNVYLRYNDPQWIQTVKQTTFFINGTLKKEDLFYALPYDCLYYYLTSKRTPTRQLILFEFNSIPAYQEKKIIAELIKNNVKMVLMSSRESTLEFRRGIFGKTYCPLLYNFIKENYYPVAQFGEWTMPSGWIRNHGTMLLKLKGT